MALLLFYIISNLSLAFASKKFLTTSLLHDIIVNIIYRHIKD